MQRNLIFAVAVVFVAIAMCPPVMAQTAGFNGATSSLFGNRTIGQGISSRSASGSAGFGGASGFSNTPGNAMAQQQSQAGQVTGSERFLEQNRQPGQFVGADTADATNAFSQLGGTGGIGRGTTGLGGFGTGLGGFGLNNFGGLSQFGNNQQQNFGAGRTGNNGRAIRTSLQLGFDYPTTVSPQLSGQIGQRLSNLPQIRTSVPFRVSVDGRTAILQGTVATEHERDLAARVVLLEPGISDVRNELTVDPAVSTGAPLPYANASR
jgi:hypothetical protein